MRWIIAVALGALILGCDDGAGASGEPAGEDAQVGDARLADDGRLDAALPVIRPDGGAPDAGLPHANPPDATLPDAALPDAAPGPAACEGRYSPASEIGPMGHDALVEASGIVASRANPGVVWVHNDSGDGPYLFALSVADGRFLARLEILNSAAEDIEDIAAAPCPDASGPCLWVADTGDNLRARSNAEVLALPEPILDGTAEISAPELWRFPVTYPGGSADSEALAVRPDGGAFWLFEKVDEGPARVFAHNGPLVEGPRTILRVAAEIEAPGVPVARGRMITAVDMHPSGRRLALRVYTGSYEYRLGAGQSLADLAAIEPSVVSLGPLSEQQGEAIAYDETGLDLLTVSEDTGLQPGQPLHRYRCLD